MVRDISLFIVLWILTMLAYKSGSSGVWRSRLSHPTSKLSGGEVHSSFSELILSLLKLHCQRLSRLGFLSTLTTQPHWIRIDIFTNLWKVAEPSSRRFKSFFDKASLLSGVRSYADWIRAFPLHTILKVALIHIGLQLLLSSHEWLAPLGFLFLDLITLVSEDLGVVAIKVSE